MKSILTIVLLTFGLLTYSQITNTNNYWVAIESNSIKKCEVIRPMDGLIIGFKGNQLEMTHVYSDSIFHFPLKIKRDKIFIQDSLFGKLRYQDSDSILIDFDGKMRVKFKPLEQGLSIDKSLDFSDYTDWIFSYNGYEQKLKLLQNPWFYSPNAIAKLCIKQSLRSNYRRINAERWTVKNIRNYKLFIKSTGQFEDEIYQIKSYCGDTILLRDLTYCDTSVVRLVKEKKIVHSEKERIFKTLHNHKWHSNRLISKATAMIGRSEEDEISGLYLMDTTLLRKESLEYNKLSFVFSDNLTYKIYEADTIRRKGTWRLSNNGEQIILDSGFMPYDYIDLIEVQSDTITIGKNDDFHVAEKEYIEYYYKLSLEKE